MTAKQVGPDPAASGAPAALAPQRDKAAGHGLASLPPRRGVRLGAIAAAVLLVLLLAAIALPFGLYAGLKSESGTAWLLPRVPGLVITGQKGALLGNFSADRAEWLLPGPGDRLVLEAPVWRGLTLTRSPDPRTWLALRLQSLSATRATLTLAPRPPSTEPSVAPGSLRSPVSVQVDALSLGEFRTAALGDQPLRDVKASLSLGADGGRLHRIDGLQLSWDKLSASGSLQVGSDAPLPLQVQLQVRPLAALTASPTAAAPAASASAGAGATGVPGANSGAGNRSTAKGAPAVTPAGLEDWLADARLSGPLARPALQASVKTRSPTAEPLLEADAVLLPFAAWPLADLSAQTRGLDLATFAAAAPKTALSGKAVIRSSGMNQAAEADIALDNADAGLWNEGKLPLRRLRLALQARPDQPQVATVQRFEAELGSARRSAGRLTGKGGIDNGRWTLDTTLDGVSPQGLDVRAAAMRLSGTLALGGGTEAGASVSGAAPGASAGTPNAAASAAVTLLTVRAALNGRLDNPAPATAERAAKPTATRSPSGKPVAKPAAAVRSAQANRPTTRPPGAGRDVQLALDGTARLGANGAIQLDLKRADASAGLARAKLDGQLMRRDDQSPWQVQAQATLAEFDPQPWWAGADDSPWRRGPHRLNAKATLDLSVSEASASTNARPASGVGAGGGAGTSTGSGKGPSTRTGAGTSTGTGNTKAAAAPAADLFAALAPLRGKVDLLLQPSLLAGVALEGKAQLQSRGDIAGPGQVDATLALTAAGNRLNAQLSTRGDRPAADQWQFDVDAPALAALSPAAALFGLAPAPGAGKTPPRVTTATTTTATAAAAATAVTATTNTSAPTSSTRSAGVASRAAGTTASPGRSTAARASAAPGLALSGSLKAQAKLTGRWPTVRTEGRLDAQALRAGSLALQRGDLRWTLGTQADAPADLQATLSQLSVGGIAADAATLRLSGTARAHQITLTADSRALPPAWTEALSGPARPPAAVTLAAPAASASAANASAAAGTSAGSTTPATRAATAPITNTGTSPTSASLRAEGGLSFARADAGGTSTLTATGWRGTLQELTARSGTNQANAIGLRSRDVAIETAWAADAPARVALQPGRLELQAGPTTAALRWNKLAWQAAMPASVTRPASAEQIDADAELDPLAVAPLLARLQPDFGWGGDLQIAAKLVMKSSPGIKADLVIERRRGDLSVTDEIGSQMLGLTDLRLALNADNGVWSFTQALAGSTVGVAAGAVVARPGSDTAWPDAATPIQGVLELRVANLGSWGPWVPAGWRLGGALNTSASIAGRVGAPEYTGSLRASGLTVRNFAEGVNVADGEVAIALQGTTARIEKFSARAGNGTVGLTGGASFGSAPKANLTLTADKFQLLGRVDRRIVASGQGQLQLEAERVALDGQFSVDEGLIDFTRGDAPSLSDDVVVIRPPKGKDGAGQVAAVTQQVAEQKAGVAASKLGSEAEVARKTGAAPAKPPTSQRVVALNLRVNLGDQLRLRGRGIDTGLRGDLRITSPGGRLAVNGTVSTQGGTYAAYGQKLTIDRGSVIFSGGIDNPRLDIEATRPNTDVRVGVIVGGTAANPRIRLFSEPELPEVDKLSWLVLGRATDGLGRTDTALLQRAAMALLSGEGEGMTTRLTRAIGLDDVSLRQTDGEVRETVISLGKQLSKRWYVGYERGLNATAGSWQLIYRVAQRLTLRAQSGFENSLDVIWTWRWQ